MKRNKQGFTLLELLVVIGIIAMLVAIGTVSYSSAQQKARNSKRRADMKAMQGALEQYHAAQTTAAYPTTCSDASSYLKSAWPVDPGTYTYSPVCNASSYCLCAQLEGTANGNSNDSTCSSWVNGTGAYYCLGSLQ